MTDSRRTTPRRNAFTFGTLHLQDEAVACLVWDESDLGAQIELESPIAVPDQVRVATNPTAPVRPAQVAWRRGRRLGLTFLPL